MSHADYIAELDEDQLCTLIESAQAKLRQIRESSWIKLWVASTEDINHAWFHESEYSIAIECLSLIGRARAEKYPEGLELRLEKHREQEAMKLIAETRREFRALFK